MLAKGHDWVQVTQQAQHAFNVKLQQRLKRTVWLSGCKSWYLTTTAKDGSSTAADHPGGTASTAAAASHVRDSSAAGRSEAVGADSNSGGGGVVMWPGLCAEFWWRTLWPAAQDWQSGKAAHPAGVVEKPGGVARKDTAMQDGEVAGQKGL
jgi:hypothetical protein